jgi:hypothetical protein
MCADNVYRIFVNALYSMLTTQQHSSQYPHPQHIPTHNVVREVRFANTFEGSVVIWLLRRYLPR